MIVAQELTGKSVVSTREGKVLGTIKQCVCHLGTGEIVGLLVDASEPLAGEKAVAGKDIAVIGEDAVLVDSEKRLVALSDVKGMADLARPAEAEALAVFTTDGRRLGSVGRIMIDEKRKAVVCFELTGGALRNLAEGPSMMPIVPGLLHGEDSVIVPPEAVSKVEAGEGGLTRIWRSVSSRLSQLGRERRPAKATAKKAAKAQPAKREEKPPKKAAAAPAAKPKKKASKRKMRKRA